MKGTRPWRQRTPARPRHPPPATKKPYNRTPIRPTLYTVVQNDTIPEPLPHEIPRAGYYATVISDIAVLPSGNSLHLTFETCAAGDHFATMVRQAAKKAGMKVVCEVRNEGLTRYFRLADKAKPSWAKAGMVGIE